MMWWEASQLLEPEPGRMKIIPPNTREECPWRRAQGQVCGNSSLNGRGPGLPNMKLLNCFVSSVNLWPTLYGKAQTLTVKGHNRTEKQVSG